MRFMPQSWRARGAGGELDARAVAAAATGGASGRPWGEDGSGARIRSL
jgi:hypothetical protein